MKVIKCSSLIPFHHQSPQLVFSFIFFDFFFSQILDLLNTSNIREHSLSLSHPSFLTNPLINPYLISTLKSTFLSSATILTFTFRCCSPSTIDFFTNFFNCSKKLILEFNNQTRFFFPKSIQAQMKNCFLKLYPNLQYIS